MATTTSSFFRNLGFPSGVETSTDALALVGFRSDHSDKQGVMPLGVVKPKTADDVQRTIRWAVENNVPLLPVSSGEGPRLRGDTVSMTPSVIVDLSSMTKIMNVAVKDAVVLAEAGVTFEQLDAAIEKQGLRTFRPLFTRSSKSVLMAALDRTPLTVPGKNWDPVDPLAVLEFVFGTGDLFRTGVASLPGSMEHKLKLGNAMMFGMGPAHTDFARVLNGAQGAMGIATFGSFHCRRIPHTEVPYFVSSDNLSDVVAFMYQELRRRTEGQLFLLNAAQFMLMFDIDPESAEAKKLPKWIAYVELACQDYFPEENIAYQTEQLNGFVKKANVTLSQNLGGVASSEVTKGQSTYAWPTPAGNASTPFHDVFGLTQLNLIEGHLQALAAKDLDDAAIYIQPINQGVSAHCQFTYLENNKAGLPSKDAALEAALCITDTDGFLNRPYYPWAKIPFDRNHSTIPLIGKTKELFDPDRVLKPGAESLGGIL